MWPNYPTGYNSVALQYNITITFLMRFAASNEIRKCFRKVLGFRLPALTINDLNEKSRTTIMNVSSL